MIELEPDDFNSLLNNLGQSVAWRRAHECPCRDRRSGAVDPACRVCQNGRIWDKTRCGAIALAGQQVQRAWAQSGMWENGDVVCTLPSDSPVYGMHEFDRVVFADSSSPFSFFLVNSGVQRLDFSVERIERVLWLSPDKSAIIEGRIPVVRDDGELRWTTGGPPAGINYTVTGRKHPEYFCFGPYPQDRAHHHGKPLPRRVVLRNFDLYGRAA